MATRVELDGRRAWWVLGLLTLSFSLAYIDRQMLNLLVDPIRRSLGLTDTQFSLMQGLAFVSAYLAAIPVFGRLVDVTNRRNILIFGVCCWSICTALCGRADTYAELMAARFGIGVSEACVFPVAWSLIGDYFSPRRSARANSIFILGSGIGGALSLVASGLVISFSEGLRNSIPALGTLEVWQMAFVVVGLPGLLFAPVLLTIQEPVRQRNALAGEDEPHLALRDVTAALWRRRDFYSRIYLGIGMIAIVQLGLPAWFPTLLIRVYEVPPAEVGFRIGFFWIAFGSAATLLGPVIARWLEARGHTDAALRVAAFATLGIIACCAAVPITGSATGALAASTGVMFFSGLPLGIIAGATQLATPSRMRGTVAALYSFCTQLIGYGVAPTAVALLTDKGFGDPKMVGYSLQIVTVAAATVAALMFFTVLPVFRKILKAAAPSPVPALAVPA